MSSDNTFIKKANFPFTYGDIAAIEEVRFNDYFVNMIADEKNQIYFKIIKNLKYQKIILLAGFGLIIFPASSYVGSLIDPRLMSFILAYYERLIEYYKKNGLLVLLSDINNLLLIDLTC
jgi:hypothetical protein